MCESWGKEKNFDRKRNKNCQKVIHMDTTWWRKCLGPRKDIFSWSFISCKRFKDWEHVLVKYVYVSEWVSVYFWVNLLSMCLIELPVTGSRREWERTGRAEKKEAKEKERERTLLFALEKNDAMGVSVRKWVSSFVWKMFHGKKKTGEKVGTIFFVLFYLSLSLSLCSFSLLLYCRHLTQVSLGQNNELSEKVMHFVAVTVAAAAVVVAAVILFFFCSVCCCFFCHSYLKGKGFFINWIQLALFDGCFITRNFTSCWRYKY